MKELKLLFSYDEWKITRGSVEDVSEEAVRLLALSFNFNRTEEEEKEYTEYASPRFSRTSWKSLALIEPPKIALIAFTTSSLLSPRGPEGYAIARCICSMGLLFIRLL